MKVREHINNLITLFNKKNISVKEDANNLSKLAELFHDQEKYEEAEGLYNGALVILEKELGTEHLEVAETLSDLAGLFKTQENYEEAEPLLRKALSIYEKELEAEDPDTIKVRNNLEELLQERKNKGW